MSDPTVREHHFTTPTTLLTTGKGNQTSDASANVPSVPNWDYCPKGKGESKKREAEGKS